MFYLYGRHKIQVETNCGHAFCCQCWINLETHLNVVRSVRRIRCPLCRQKVSILYQCFSEAELNSPRNSENVGDVDKFLNKIKLYNNLPNSDSADDSDSDNYTDIDSDECSGENHYSKFRPES